MTKIFVALTFLTLSSCATLSKQECQNMDWKQVGYTSALEGEPSGDSVGRYMKLCKSKYDISVNGNQFADGYKLGLEKYCTQENLYKVGSSGKEYKGICKTVIPQSESNYTDGRIKFLEKRVADLEYEIHRLNSANSALQYKINSCSNGL